MENSSVSDDLREIVDGLRRVITKSLANAQFQTSKPANQPDIELAVLAGLSEGGKNGAALVNQIRLASAGTYTPNQAQVQQVLESFVEKRLAKIVVVEDARLYELTKLGKTEFEARKTSQREPSETHDHTAPCSKCSQNNWAPHPGVLAAGAKLAQTVVEASAGNHASKHEATVLLLEETRRKLQELLSEKH